MHNLFLDESSDLLGIGELKNFRGKRRSGKFTLGQRRVPSSLQTGRCCTGRAAKKRMSFRSWLNARRIAPAGDIFPSINSVHAILSAYRAVYHADYKLALSGI